MSPSKHLTTTVTARRLLLRLAGVVLLGIAGLPLTARAETAGATPPGTSKTQPLTIRVVADPIATVGLDGNLVIRTSQVLNPGDYVLFLNAHPIPGLDDKIFDPARNALVFRLERNDTNAAVWRAILGSPTAFARRLSVGLGRSVPDGQTPVLSVPGADEKLPVVAFVIATPVRFWAAVLLVLGVVTLVFVRANRSVLLKDNLIPQIPPARQTFSLARCQMAFWFLLILASYVFLYVVLGDSNTLSDQALLLMGISGATALGAIAVDAAKDTPEDTLDSGLQLLGLKTYADVARIEQEIADRRITLGAVANPPSAASAAILNAEIIDRQLVLRSYETAIKPFVSQGLFNDILSDANGTALHRLQILCWTLLLGGIFLIGVWQNLAMPAFSNTLLALMGISSAGYVGFKYSEAN